MEQSEKTNIVTVNRDITKCSKELVKLYKTAEDALKAVYTKQEQIKSLLALKTIIENPEITVNTSKKEDTMKPKC